MSVESQIIVLLATYNIFLYRVLGCVLKSLSPTNHTEGVIGCQRFYWVDFVFLFRYLTIERNVKPVKTLFTSLHKVSGLYTVDSY